MRLKDFQKELKKKNISAALLANSRDRPSPSFLYFTGFNGTGVLLITPVKALLFVHDMEYLSAKQVSRVRQIKKSDNILVDLIKFLRGKKKIGIDKDRTSLNSFSRLKKKLSAKFIDVSGICSSLRCQKTAEEIRLIRKACAFTDDIFHNTFLNFKGFKTESDVAAFMSYEAAKKGLDLAFPPIVASGLNSAKPHHEPEARRLKRGFCIIDFGVRYKGLCSDMTRTIFIGKPTQKEIDLYYKLYCAQQKAIDICLPSKSFFDIDKYAKKMLGSLAKRMNHSLGHGVGFECHEQPLLRKKAKDSGNLLPNCVITVEPGIYFSKKGGIRIEDTVLITDKGPKPLTRTGKNLLIIRK